MKWNSFKFDKRRILMYHDLLNVFEFQGNHYLVMQRCNLINNSFVTTLWQSIVVYLKHIWLHFPLKEKIIYKMNSMKLQKQAIKVDFDTSIKIIFKNTRCMSSWFHQGVNYYPCITFCCLLIDTVTPFYDKTNKISWYIKW